MSTFENHADYLVSDWTGKKEGEEPTLTRIHGDEIFDLLQDAQKKKIKISVSVIGACVIDWS